MHTILVVEDDDAVAHAFDEICASIECKTVRAATLADVKQRIAEGGFCAVILDMQIPVDPGGRPLVSAGETALELLRKYDRRRTEDGRVLPIIAVTGYSSAWDYVARLFTAGIDDFIPKSFDDGTKRSFSDRLDTYLARIREAFVKAGRADHALCEGLERTRPMQGAARPLVTIRVAAEMNGKQLVARVNGEPRELPPALFVLLARLALAHRRDPGAFPTHADLGVARTPHSVRRLRDALRGGLPDSFPIVEAKYGVGARLEPTTRVEIDDAALARHPLESVRRLFRAAARVEPRR
jgi:CheY-like chemotaxis protein